MIRKSGVKNSYRITIYGIVDGVEIECETYTVTYIDGVYQTLVAYFKQFVLIFLFTVGLSLCDNPMGKEKKEALFYYIKEWS